MEIRSIYRGARVSAFKAREVTREIQGLPAATALDVLGFSPKKAAILIGKTLKSAIANAENNANLRANTLVVKEATVGEGPSFKRFRARARGSASPIIKRTSHIRIILSDELELPDSRKVQGSKKKASTPVGKKGAKNVKAGTKAKKAKETAHVHGPECDHDHEHAQEAKTAKKAKVTTSAQEKTEVSKAKSKKDEAAKGDSKE